MTQAAECEDPNSAILSYGFGSDAPHSARRRLKQSVAMARKLLATQKQLNAKTVACAGWEEKHAQVRGGRGYEGWEGCRRGRAREEGGRCVCVGWGGEGNMFR